MLQALKERITGKSPITREQILTARPLRHPKIEWTREPRRSDEVVVALLQIPRLRGKWADLVAKWLQVPDFKRVELDEIGSDVWVMCDGSTDVAAIAKAIGTSYRLNKRQAEVSVTAYLKTLAERRLIALKSATGAKANTSAKTVRKRAA